MITQRKRLAILLMLIFTSVMLSAEEPEVIRLSWDEVGNRCRLDNLSLKMNALDEDSQQQEVNRAWGGFLPTLDYTWLWSDDEADDAYLLPENLFIHSLQLTFPLFTGGARIANLKMQKHLQKSMTAEFKGAEDGVVLQAMQAYYGAILADEMVEVYREAQILAETNLRQVESFRDAGTATELAVKQARTRYFESIPQLASAQNQKKLSLKQLKYLLNIAAEDSLEVNDDLVERQFLGSYAGMKLEEIRILAHDNRSEVEQIIQQNKAVTQQKMLAFSKFLPVVALTAGTQHVAYSEDWSVKSEEFDRSNSIGLAVQLPLFNGGSRYFDLKVAGNAKRKMNILLEQVIDQVELDAEQSYYTYLEARDNLKSQEEALAAAEESLRLVNLYYAQGMVSQTEVLGAQLAYTQNQAAMKNGIFLYNTSQLALLKAIGDLHCIWK
ncbi:MAG: TolC family protein [Candidatus Cloacimonetes bacterium]|nr:TolC family protein [Candidatus Cloacimonadota bacterium]